VEIPAKLGTGRKSQSESNGTERLWQVPLLQRTSRVIYDVDLHPIDTYTTGVLFLSFLFCLYLHLHLDVGLLLYLDPCCLSTACFAAGCVTLGVGTAWRVLQHIYTL
jgi:hypothetical protein